MRLLRRFGNPVTVTILTVMTLVAVFAAGGLVSRATAEPATVKRYVVVFSSTQALDGTYQLGGNYALNYQAASHSCGRRAARSRTTS